jgi:hypothetical protein
MVSVGLCQVESLRAANIARCSYFIPVASGTLGPRDVNVSIGSRCRAAKSRRRHTWTGRYFGRVCQ